ncbi:triose-phosphate isomerase [Apibacter muscae]|uniref:triose-phosphate isomerase n=1 Tax=Apibacter muscae TaxID=2509004 RepID=UPI0011ADF8AB|nr:triose-phosphate isomerase [Apibacter muscae]TWP22818.1 triose-phosphate isomerase [Apibacter muscae]
MRKKIVAGNWKMNKTLSEANTLLAELDSYVKTNNPKCEVVVGIPYLYLANAKEKYENLNIYAEDVSEHQSGAYTGEISAEMLKSIQVDGAIIGHSERRQYHKETDEQIGAKVKIALENGLTPIFCNGELLEERKSGKHFEVVKKQTEVALFQLSPEEIKKVVIAYEPVWAIGTGETATPEQAQEIHAYIRSLIAEKYGKEIADEISILYGGSVKPANAKEIFSKPDVDGGLIGGASLNIKDFGALIQTYSDL